MIWDIMRTTYTPSEDLKTRVTLVEQLCTQLSEITRRAEQDNHDRALKEQETLVTLSRVADGLNNLSTQVIQNREFFEKQIAKNDSDTKGQLEKLVTDNNKSTNFINSARWSFTALWGFVFMLALNILSEATKHWFK